MTSEAEQGPVSGVTWEEPPIVVRTRYDWQAIADQLKERPGEWAKIFERDRTSIVNAIRQGGVRCLAPRLGFEVRTRNNERYPVRMCSLYLRYNPERDRSE